MTGAASRLALVSWAASLTLASTAFAAPPTVLTLHEAEFLLEDRETPPTAHAAKWSNVKLPDRWSKMRPTASGSGWYRFSIPRTVSSDKRWAVYLPKLNMNAAVFINGTWIGDGGSFTPPVAQNWNRPLFFTFSPDLLSRSKNTIDVRIFAYSHDWGALGPVKVGPKALLYNQYQRQFAYQITTSQLGSVWTLMMILFVAALWIGRPHDPVYRYFVLAGCAYFIHSLSSHIQDIALPYLIGRWLVHVAMDWFAVLLVITAHCWVEERKPRIERLLLGFAIAATVICALAPNRLFLTVANIFHVGDLAVAIYGYSVAFRHFRTLRSSEAALVVGGTALTVTITAYTVFILVGVLPQDSPRLLMLLSPLLMLGFGSVLVARFIRASKEADQLNRVLEQRVEEKEAELVKNFDRLRALERKQVLAGERERLMREMHDGMGAQLVSTLSMAEMGGQSQAPIAEALRESLDDLRLVIDSLDPGIDDIPLLIGTLRSRLQPRLATHGLRFRWTVEPVPNPKHLEPHHFLHILRIIQEAITNVIKHAKASVIEVHTEVRDDRVIIEVKDDGCGFGEASSGRGFTNMRRRAEAIGSEIDLIANENGTTVALSIPL